ncbi:VOC family protein, partial [Priestia megaterium]
ELLVKGKSTAYFNLNGLWLALNEEKNVPRSEIQYSYTHLAFSIAIESFDEAKELLKEHNVTILPGRSRDERDKKSLYFTDPHGPNRIITNIRIDHRKDKKTDMNHQIDTVENALD